MSGQEITPTRQAMEGQQIMNALSTVANVTPVTSTSNQLKSSTALSRPAIIAGLRDHARKHGTHNGWDLVLEMTDEQIDGIMGVRTKSVLGAVQMMMQMTDVRERNTARMNAAFEAQQAPVVETPAPTEEEQALETYVNTTDSWKHEQPVEDVAPEHSGPVGTDSYEYSADELQAMVAAEPEEIEEHVEHPHLLKPAKKAKKLKFVKAAEQEGVPA